MPRIATASTLSNHRRLSISDYRQQLTQLNTQPTVTLDYLHQGRRYSYQVEITTTPCNYGGVRYWWSCPKCSRRAAVLYCAGNYVCRHCMGLNYQSQHSKSLDRLFERVAVVRARLGWQGGIAHGHGSRPRYMHHSTYSKLVNEHDKLTAKIIGAMT